MKKLILIVNLLFFLGCTQQKADQNVDTKAEGEKVMQLSREWSEAASTGDVEKIVDYWADDAVVMSADAPIVSGKQEIRKMVEASFKMPNFRLSWQPESVVVSESGDMAYLIEDSQMSYTDSTGKPVTINEKIVSIWRKQPDGNWKNAVEVSVPKASQNK
jgi:uncharacterized protein (TIGR02246 family)